MTRKKKYKIQLFNLEPATLSLTVSFLLRTIHSSDSTHVHDDVKN